MSVLEREVGRARVTYEHLSGLDPDTLTPLQKWMVRVYGLLVFQADYIEELEAASYLEGDKPYGKSRPD